MSILQIQETEAQRGKMTNPDNRKVWDSAEFCLTHKPLGFFCLSLLLFFRSRQQNLHTASSQITNNACKLLRCNWRTHAWVCLFKVADLENSSKLQICCLIMLLHHSINSSRLLTFGKTKSVLMNLPNTECTLIEPQTNNLLIHCISPTF